MTSFLNAVLVLGGQSCFLPCNLCCVAAGFDGSDLSLRGGRVPAHQLFQLQLLALCGSVCGRPHLPKSHPARQTEARQGACVCVFGGLAQIFTATD